MKKLLLILIIFCTISCETKQKPKPIFPDSQWEFYSSLAKFNATREHLTVPQEKQVNKIQSKDYINNRLQEIRDSVLLATENYIDNWGWEIKNWRATVYKLGSYKDGERLHIVLKGWKTIKSKKTFFKYENPSSVLGEIGVIGYINPTYDSSGRLFSPGAYVSNDYSWNGDKNWGLIIEKGTDLYNQVYNLAEGELVYFSGKFLPNNNITKKNRKERKYYHYPFNSNKTVEFLAGSRRYKEWVFPIAFTNITSAKNVTVTKNKSGEVELKEKQLHEKK